jgi:hypothetical protein
MRSRDRASMSSPSDAAEESDGEMMRAAAETFPASAGMGWCEHVLRK